MAILLGAGASVDAGVPIAADLTRDALDSIGQARLSDFVSFRELHSNSDLALALAFIVNAIQAHDISVRAHSASSLSMPGIESVVSATAMLAERDVIEIAPFVGSWRNTVNSLDSIQTPDLAADFMEAFKGLFKSRGGSSYFAEKKMKEQLERIAANGKAEATSGLFSALLKDLHRHIAEAVSRFDPSAVGYLLPLLHAAVAGNHPIATLNYDSTVETAARSIGIPVDLGVEGWTATGRLNPLKFGALRLLKLHGSANWRAGPDDTLELCDSPQVDPFIVYGRREKLRSE